jgi:hypothetical protein
VDEPKSIPFGQLALQRGLLDEGQLEVALAEHLSTGKELSEVIVDRGWMTREQLADLLGGHLEAEQREPDRDEAGEGEGAAPTGHVLFVWTPAGYELLSRSGRPPRIGEEVGVSGGARVVTKIGPSPLPGDPRPCAYLDAPG